jgi:hypothetical protein
LSDMEAFKRLEVSKAYYKNANHLPYKQNTL